MGAAKRDSVELKRSMSGGRDMMGRLTAGQGQLFYAFHLDEVVPADHVVRRVDAVLDLGWIHQELAPFYSNTGRPSTGSRVMRVTDMGQASPTVSM